MEYLCQTCISSKWRSLFLRHAGNFGLVSLIRLLEVAFIVSFMFQYCICFLNVNINTEKHPYCISLWVGPKPDTWSWARQGKVMWYLSVTHTSSKHSRASQVKGGFCRLHECTLFTTSFKPYGYPSLNQHILKCDVIWDVLVFHVCVDQIKDRQKYVSNLLPIWPGGSSDGRSNSNFQKPRYVWHLPPKLSTDHVYINLLEKELQCSAFFTKALRIYG